MKSGSQMPGVLRAIEEHASLANSAMIQNCGLPNERVFPNLAREVPQESTGYFATVIVKE